MNQCCFILKKIICEPISIRYAQVLFVQYGVVNMDDENSVIRAAQAVPRERIAVRKASKRAKDAMSSRETTMLERIEQLQEGLRRYP